MEKFEKVEIGENCTLYCGDAFEILPELEDGSIDMIASDPPYAAQTFGGKCTDNIWDKPIPLPEFWKLAESKTKPAANIILFGNMKLAHDLINTNPRNFRYDMVWHKNNRTNFLNANLRPLASHESILVFGKSGGKTASTFNPLKSSDGVNPHTTLSFSHDRGNQPGLHPCQKPVNLLAWLIMTFSNPGDLILDMFMGSGTSLEAGIRLGRRVIGVEKHKPYFDIACKRLEAVQRRRHVRFGGVKT